MVIGRSADRIFTIDGSALAIIDVADGAEVGSYDSPYALYWYATAVEADGLVILATDLFGRPDDSGVADGQYDGTECDGGATILEGGGGGGEVLPFDITESADGAHFCFTDGGETTLVSIPAGPTSEPRSSSQREGRSSGRSR